MIIVVDLDQYCYEGHGAKKQNNLMKAQQALTESTRCPSGRLSVRLSYLAANKYIRKYVYVLSFSAG